MADRPIIFSAPMVRALQDGRKTQTRRVLNRSWSVLGSSWAAKSAPWGGLLFNHPLAEARRSGLVGNDPHVAVPFLHPEDAATGREWDGDGIYRVRPPYAVGDRLWCREAHYVWSAGHKDGSGRLISYRADEPDAPCTWSPSIHMPRWASRLTLTVTDVRVQRLQEISREDARAEGFPITWDGKPYDPPPPDIDSWQGYGVASFCLAWSKLYGPAAWDANPWVVAVTFTVERRNIDAGAG